MRISTVSKTVAIALLALAFCAAVWVLQPDEALGAEYPISYIQDLEMAQPNDGLAIVMNSAVIAGNPLPTWTLNKTKYPTGSYVSVPRDFDQYGGLTIGAGQCVNWVVGVTGLESYGNAKEWARYIDRTYPAINSVVVMKVTEYLWHVGIVIDIHDGKILVRSRNWDGKWIVSDDWFDISDERLIGYKMVY